MNISDYRMVEVVGGTEEGGRLDLKNPPKYCPQCQRKQLKNKVKKFRMKSGSLVLMCKSDQV